MRTLLTILLVVMPAVGFAQDAPKESAQATEQTDDEVLALAVRVRAMRPKAAGLLLAQLPVELAANVLLTLSPSKGGRILNYVPAARAAAIAAQMAGQNEEAS